MSVAQQESSAIVTRAIQEINHIATLPEITLRIVELVENPNSTAQDLQRVISHDPALCSRVLKVVNSAFYGLPGQIASIERAIVLLGLNAVKNIAVAASLVKLFRGGELTPAFSARDLWVHSIAVSAASKMIADEAHIGLSDEAFLAGLMHDIGVMVELQFDRQRLITVLDKLGVDNAGNPQGDMLALETEIFSATHQQFGEGLCKRWKFPASLASAAGHHHDPLSLPEGQRALPCIVCAADCLSAQAKQGYRLDLRDTNIPAGVLDELRLTNDQITRIRELLPERLQEIKSVLGG